MRHLIFIQRQITEISCRNNPRVSFENEVTQSCPTLCDPMDYSLPGFSVHGIFQARVLEWVAISFNSIKFYVNVPFPGGSDGKGFSAFLDLRRCKDLDHKICS